MSASVLGFQVLGLDTELFPPFGALNESFPTHAVCAALTCALQRCVIQRLFILPTVESMLDSGKRCRSSQVQTGANSVALPRKSGSAKNCVLAHWRNELHCYEPTSSQRELPRQRWSSHQAVHRYYNLWFPLLRQNTPNLNVCGLQPTWYFAQWHAGSVARGTVGWRWGVRRPVRPPQPGGTQRQRHWPRLHRPSRPGERTGPQQVRGEGERGRLRHRSRRAFREYPTHIPTDTSSGPCDEFENYVQQRKKSIPVYLTMWKWNAQFSLAQKLFYAPEKSRNPCCCATARRPCEIPFLETLFCTAGWISFWLISQGKVRVAFPKKILKRLCCSRVHVSSVWHRTPVSIIRKRRLQGRRFFCRQGCFSWQFRNSVRPVLQISLESGWYGFFATPLVNFQLQEESQSRIGKLKGQECVFPQSGLEKISWSIQGGSGLCHGIIWLQ